MEMPAGMEAKLQEYARLLIEMGINIQKGQNLVLSCPVDIAWFARMCVRAAYDAGCREVIMDWSDEQIAREKYFRAADDVFTRFPTWRAEFCTSLAKSGAGFLSIDASDPENLKGVDPKRLRNAQRSAEEPLKEYRHMQMANVVPWCIAAIPHPKWAKKVFPDVGEEEAIEKLWAAILETMRITGDGKSLDRWREHVDALRVRVDMLNALDLERLHYTNRLGTNLTIHLPEGHVWSGGRSVTTSGTPFIANMPTEEIFTAPRRDGIDGVVYASLPKVLHGNIVDHFYFVIKEGKIVEVHAETGADLLQTEISLDEGASHFGEVALVPYDSPISRQKLLYYNTLFDENASCHLAFGEAYPESIRGGEEMSEEELQAHGLNKSITHVDVMVGTADLSIVGTTKDGREVPIFTDGNFSLE